MMPLLFVIRLAVMAVALLIGFAFGVTGLVKTHVAPPPPDVRIVYCHRSSPGAECIPVDAAEQKAYEASAAATLATP